MKVTPKNRKKKNRKDLFVVRPPITPVVQPTPTIEENRTTPSQPPYPAGVSANPEATVAWCIKNCKFAAV